MGNRYYIVYNPVTYNLMESIGNCKTPLDLLSDITNKNTAKLNRGNYLEYLEFDKRKEKLGMVETFAIESYAIIYVANQVAKFAPKARVILSDGIRTGLKDIILKNGKPAGVFISSMSSNFPTAVCTSIALNHGRIPVVLGGIHVSSSPQDVDLFIKQQVPNPKLVCHVRGGADTDVMGRVIKDLNKGTLKPSYTGYKMVEDRVWGHENIEFMPPMKMNRLRRLPLVGNILADKIRVNPTAPYLGCPYSCSFCSISSLPRDLRQFTIRTPEDIINEIDHIQRQGINLKTRLFFFLADNIIIGGKHLEALLDLLLARKTKINYMVQVSIEVADNDRLLKKMRLSGASHLFIGFESLDLRDLKLIGKNVAKDIEASGKSVADYYSERIKKIQRHGMTIHGSFILGLPHDYFNSIHDNTGHDYGRFCVEHHIGVQATPLSDLPGSRDFIATQKNKTYLFGKNGTMDYLIALVVCDLTEGNRIPNASVKKSPLVLLHMAFETINHVGQTRHTFKNAFYMMAKSFLYPTANGRRSFMTRLNDALVGFTVPLLVSLYKDHAEMVLSSTPHARGSFERLYDMEKDPAIKKEFRAYVKGFFHR
ncbi:MAG: radical SAM protein [Proteobacteria bacterium]|nr:radical SAM protein [Pseudomonadota bacterium]MBU4129544.1 radical SAM protein [Pseudomonadota bacterium]